MITSPLPFSRSETKARLCFNTTLVSLHAAGAAYGVGRLERLPKWLNLIPMITQWFFLAVQYRSITLPSSINPAIISGGMVGEGKLEYFNSMGNYAHKYVAAYSSIVNMGPERLQAAKNAMRSVNLFYPVIMKPDIGWCGFGVRLVHNDQELEQYLNQFPLKARVIFQCYLPQDGEAGIYYTRSPESSHGHIIAIVLRHYPSVTGDGVRSINELMVRDKRSARLGRDGLSEARVHTHYIPSAGEHVRLTTIGSTRVGGLYTDASELITKPLINAIDLIAKDMQNFHVGRFDIRYDSLEALTNGNGFKIMEVNGAGSEAVHAWDPKFTLRQAYSIVFDKQRMLFSMGDKMRQRGHKPVGVLKLVQLYLHQQRLIRRYPASN